MGVLSRRASNRRALPWRVQSDAWAHAREPVAEIDVDVGHREHQILEVGEARGGLEDRGHASRADATVELEPT